MIRKLERLRLLGTALRDDPNHLRDHVAGPAHPHRIPDPHVLAVDLVLVVKGRVGDGHPADDDRLQPRYGGQRAGSAHLHVDVGHAGECLLGRKLVCDCPSRRPRHLSDGLACPHVVQLEHHTVDVVTDRVAASRDIAVVREAGIDAFEHPGVRRHRHSPGSQHLEQVRVPMRKRRILADQAHAVAVHAQWPGGGDTRVELAKRAGRGVARVCIRPFSAVPLPLVHRLEPAPGHEDLSSDLDECRMGLAQEPQGDRPDGANVRGDVPRRGPRRRGSRRARAFHLRTRD